MLPDLSDFVEKSWEGTENKCDSLYKNGARRKELAAERITFLEDELRHSAFCHYGKSVRLRQFKGCCSVYCFKTNRPSITHPVRRNHFSCFGFIRKTESGHLLERASPGTLPEIESSIDLIRSILTMKTKRVRPKDAPNLKKAVYGWQGVPRRERPAFLLPQAEPGLFRAPRFSVAFPF